MAPQQPGGVEMTSEPHRSVWRVVWLVALPLLSAASVAWWRMGELAEPFGSDKNFSLPFAEDNATRIGVAGAVLGCVVIAQLVRTRLSLGQLRFVVGSVLIGVMFGMGLRVMTAITGGANIGGGAFLMFGIPILTGATIVLAVWVARRRPPLASPARQSYER